MKLHERALFSIPSSNFHEDIKSSGKVLAPSDNCMHCNLSWGFKVRQPIAFYNLMFTEYGLDVAFSMQTGFRGLTFTLQEKASYFLEIGGGGAKGASQQA